VPQHDRKNIVEINTHPFVPSSSSGRALSLVEGLREEFFNRLPMFNVAPGGVQIVQVFHADGLRQGRLAATQAAINVPSSQPGPMSKSIIHE
jgi:hypothetical protein